MPNDSRNAELSEPGQSIMTWAMADDVYELAGNNGLDQAESTAAQHAISTQRAELVANALVSVLEMRRSEAAAAVVSINDMLGRLSTQLEATSAEDGDRITLQDLLERSEHNRLATNIWGILIRDYPDLLDEAHRDNNRMAGSISRTHLAALLETSENFIGIRGLGTRSAALVRRVITHNSEGPS